jgi:hypothetical protein
MHDDTEQSHGQAWMHPVFAARKWHLTGCIKKPSANLGDAYHPYSYLLRVAGLDTPGKAAFQRSVVMEYGKPPVATVAGLSGASAPSAPTAYCEMVLLPEFTA